MDFHVAITTTIRHPLFLIGLTLVAYQIAHWCYVKSKRFGLLNPVLWSVIIIVVALWLLKVEYREYFQKVQVIHLLLGPATVALAIPLYDNMARIRSLWLPILLTLFVTGCTTIAATWWLAKWFGMEQKILLTLTTKSITTPIALVVTEQIGGYPALAATFVVFVGIVGAVIGLPLLKLVGVNDSAVQGVAMGFSAHAIGTARALEQDSSCGGFSALGMGLMGVATAVLLPIVIAVFG